MDELSLNAKQVQADLDKINTEQAWNLSEELAKIAQTTSLTERQLAIAPVAYFTALGQLDALKVAVAQALEAGLTPEQLQEVFLHQYAYAGFPRALNGLLTFQGVLQERKIEFQNNLITAYDKQVDYYQLGEKMLSILTQRDMRSITLNNFPGIDTALKAHLFGYLFARDQILSPVDRELVTVSTLTALETVPSQLRSHLTIVKNLGISKAEAQKFINSLKEVNAQAVTKAQEVLTAVYQ
ncbi:carboxymuconolactone decarboxylase family protein [Psittacicella gerlachiana]|uniref:Carboxymuconolactone decarboxylase-like domain-containing protein n=1 Tax=Psittacicella gerlachiana TaxID=2028574 RepID=A0A3A1Y6R4_9GAMM|nr:carboxymuconolactone decarboxylase family protein [Psittacicella gerlachiana]RIY32908.1 hypothetical protein CKF59_06660 [Psittacicella gerlachiana]